jgi:hypothetical protein
MVRHHLKGFRKNKDPLGIIHSYNARGISTGRTSGAFIPKFSDEALTSPTAQAFLQARAARAAQAQPSRVIIPQAEISPIPDIPEVTPIPKAEKPSLSLEEITPPIADETRKIPQVDSEKVSFAQPKETEEPSSSSLSFVSTEEHIVTPPPTPPKVGELTEDRGFEI